MTKNTPYDTKRLTDKWAAIKTSYTVYKFQGVKVYIRQSFIEHAIRCTVFFVFFLFSRHFLLLEKEFQSKFLCKFGEKKNSSEMDEIVEKIRARIAKVDPNGPRKVAGVFQLNVKSADGSTRAITLDLNKLEVLDGNVHDAPDVSVDFDTETLEQVTKNETSLVDAIETGKATLSGDVDLATKLGNIISTKPIE